MQFKEQGGKVQVLLYAGYDEIKKVPRIKPVGSFDKYTYKPSPGLMDKLNAHQREELEAEWRRRREVAVGLNRQHYIKSLVPTLHGVCESLRNEVPLAPEEAERIWEALEDLSKAMRQAGYAKPGRTKLGTMDPQQPTLLE